MVATCHGIEFVQQLMRCDPIDAADILTLPVPLMRQQETVEAVA